MELPRNTQNECPIANVCELNSPEAPPCGKDNDHLPPLIPAELMCARALAGRVQLETDQIAKEERPALASEKYAAAAWFELELGLAEPTTTNAEQHLGSALEHANSAMHDPYSWFRGAYSAAMLHLYRPLLIARKQNLPGLQELKSIQQGLGDMYDSLHAVPVHVPQSQHILDARTEGRPHRQCLAEEGERIGLMTKLVGMMIAARQNILLYAGSMREAHACGTASALNHDAYKLDENGQKVLVKFRAKAKADVSARGTRLMNYVDTTRYINVRAIINRALEGMQRTQREQYDSLLRSHGHKRPDIVDIGRLLRTESLQVKNVSKAERALLDAIAASMEQSLLDGEDDPAKLRENILPSRTTEAEVPSTGEKAAWEILPAEITSLHDNPNMQDDPVKLTAAFGAVESYLRHAHVPLDPRRLQWLIGVMRQVTDPFVVANCVGAYVDLARNPQTVPSDAVRLIEASETLARTLVAKDWSNLQPHEIQAQHYADLHSVYAQKYKKTLSGEAFDISDEIRLYMQLLELGRKTLEPARYFSDPRGIQFEIGLHIMNARFNLRNRQMLQSMWPSLPREDDPHDFNMQFRTAWDAAVSRGSFLDQTASCRYLQCKSIDRGMVYDPSITVIVSKDDFPMANSAADIIQDALKEQEAKAPAHRARVQARLKQYEQIFLAKLAFS